MSNTLVVQNNNTGVDKIEMLSTQVVDMINGFRAEEGNRKVLRHNDFLKSIRKEIEALENAGVEVGQGNISQSSYINSQNKEQPCYRMNRFWIMQMCNKESALVRYKTQQYIEALENRLKQQTQMINKQYEDRLDRLEGMAATMETVVTMVKSLTEVVEKLVTTTKVTEQPKTRTANFRTLPTVTKIAKPFGMTGTDANKILEENGIIRRSDNGKGSILNEEYEDRWGITIYEDGKEPYVRYFELGVNSITKIFSRKINASEQQQLNLF